MFNIRVYCTYDWQERWRKKCYERSTLIAGFVENWSNLFQFKLDPLLIGRYISWCDKGHRKLITGMERIHAAKSYAFARLPISRNAGVRSVSVPQSSTHHFNTSVVSDSNFDTKSGKLSKSQIRSSFTILLQQYRTTLNRW